METIDSFTIFVLSCFVGYYLIWGITPALHSPLMSVSNAISGIIIIGAIAIVGNTSSPAVLWIGLTAITLASINIFGGFVISQRMLQMFKPKRQTKDQKHDA